MRVLFGRGYGDSALIRVVLFNRTAWAKQPRDIWVPLASLRHQGGRGSVYNLYHVTNLAPVLCCFLNHVT